MTDKHPQEWRSRREIPNSQIKDAADQYEQARLILSAQPPGTGVLLPRMNAAVMAIELYLKCLAGEVIHVPEESGLTTSTPEIDEIASDRVYAQASTRTHNFGKILCTIDEDVRSLLETTYVNETDSEFKRDLITIDDALVVTRYSFEPDKDLKRINIKTLMTISEFLRHFVASLEPRESIQWEDGSVSMVKYM